MARKRFARQTGLAALAVTVIAGLLAAAGQAASAARPAQRAVAALEAHSGAPLNVVYDALTGNVSFAMAPRVPGGPPGRSMPMYVPGAVARGDALATAIEFLDHHRALYQMSDPARELALQRITGDTLGQVHVRLGQHVNGVPVFGRVVYVHLDALGNVIGTNGNYLPGVIVDPVPRLTAETAEAQVLRTQRSTSAEVLTRELVVYAGDANVLTWKIETWDPAVPSRWFTFVDARAGGVVYVLNGLYAGLDREVYDAQNSEDLPGELAAREGEVSSEESAEAAYRFSGDVYNYFADVHNRDSFDDRGATIVSTVHFSTEFDNAFWNGYQMIYGDGYILVKRPFVLANDVVGHELTHAVTEYTAGLIYENQSGALNESYSDVFSAMVDRDDWTLGEDVINEEFVGLPYLRDLEDPNLKGLYDPNDPLAGPGQPATMSEYARLPNSRDGDWGGVHKNSGIPNHAAYLMAEELGGPVEGRLIVEQVWYRALTTYLTPTSDFIEFAQATLQATDDIYGKDGPEYRAAEAALTAVEIIGPNAPTPEPTDKPIPRRGTPSPQPTPVEQAGCRELMRDGGFEAGSGTDVWFESTLPDGIIITEDLPHSGFFSAWLGGTDEEQFASHYVRQWISVPANAQSVRLSYWYLLHAELDETLEQPASSFGVTLIDEDNQTLLELVELTAAVANEDWDEVALDASAVAGKTVGVVFWGLMAPGDRSSFYVDDVSALACTGDEPPPGPTPLPHGGDGVETGGVIVDYNTGDGIEGAVVYFLRPGLSASTAAEDYQVTQDEVFTMGVTDGDGLFELQAPLARETLYSVIVFAQGYYPIIADDAIDTGDWGEVEEFRDLIGQMQPVE